MATNDTPMMKQFNDIKAQYPDAMLLFRCGDFYETYCEDAVKASKILGITLTHRSNGTSSVAAIDMAGFPFHALDTYLPKLVRAGLRVAICDQLEDPKLTKKLVKRGVTELVTPGVSYSDTTLAAKENNFVACLHFCKSAKKDDEAVGIAFLDISTGEFLVAQGSESYAEKLLTNFKPKEVLFLRQNRQYFESLYGSRYFTFELEDWMLTEQAANDRLCKQFGTTGLKGFGVDRQPLGIIAAGGILHYLDMTQHLQTGHITALSRIEEDKYMWLDKFSLRNLELFPQGGYNEGATSLFEIIDRTSSPMGARLLRRWLTLPLKSVRPIRQRQEVVEFFFRHPDERDEIQEYITRIADLERITSKVSTGRISPKEMLQLSLALEAIEPIKQICEAAEGEFVRRLGGQLRRCADLRGRIRRTMAINPPAVQGRPGMIGQGVDAELDRLRDIHSGGKDYLLRIQQREAEETGIQSLKIGFNNVFGYYLEVRNTYKDQVPATWIRKQTLVNAERYITEELKQYEETILGAEDKIQILENRIFQELMLYANEFVPQLQLNASVIAQLDCLLSFALVAQQNHYVCPDVNDSLVIDIRQGRHPVIEKNLPIGESYIPNDVFLSNDLKNVNNNDNDNNASNENNANNVNNAAASAAAPQQVIIITGPNMAGKSALLRQTALIVLLAQIGSYVPAEAASIGIVDKIFTRVGASDNISLGESTFMVEMNEASAILNNLSSRSLVLFDELGRGTSTYDGISIAWSIVEYIHEHRTHAKTLFATHYHELNDMASVFPRIRNYNVSVREVNKRVIFLRRLVPGGSEHSFGIHVAKMAGMPQRIVDRANEILKQLEAHSAQSPLSGEDGALRNMAKGDGIQLSMFQLDDPVLSQIRDEFLHLDVNNLTPVEALNKLNDLKKIISGR